MLKKRDARFPMLGSKFERRTKMIKSKPLFFISIMLILISMALNFPFPHRYPLGETIFTNLHIPIRFANGFHTIGIISLFLLMITLFLLVKSLKKYYGRVLLIAFIIVIFIPLVIMTTYQSTLATGIYAVSYASEESNCYLEMTDPSTLHGECELTFQNHRNKDVEFTIEFYEELVFKDDLPMVSLMNYDAPYEVILKGKESRRIQFEKNIDVSNMEKSIESGEATEIQITITSNGKSRDL